ncbi:hypothetical protein VP01_4133g2 [Puccinia sorghi]|uniref:Uncharacterized protein n=1 Tax=Puccinia sorghi TaxID=27349 RepID=A0A0L6UR50_9BASI|nr:hypothetical protein VP01_4133g2 [Puccinia sorghi]
MPTHLNFHRHQRIISGNAEDKTQSPSTHRVKLFHLERQDDTAALGDSNNTELKMLLLDKMDSVTHDNVIMADNSQMFNDFLYVIFQEDSVETFVTNIKVAIKKLVDIGIKPPQDILAYLVLFKIPNLLQTLKRQIMHSKKELNVKFVCNHLIQFNSL